MAEQSKHLSIVLVGRNDNYGGDFKSRLENCIQWTFAQLLKQNYSSEIVFVNYNPLPSNPIEQFIEWPQSTANVTLKIITVPNEVHRKIIEKNPNIKDVPVLEYVAKNAGIRRASGKFILAMNPDILVEENLFSRFSGLSPKRYYRVNRIDFKSEFSMKEACARSLFGALKKNVFQIWFKGSNVEVENFSMTKYCFEWLKNEIKNKWRANSVRFEGLCNYFSIPVYYHNIEYRLHCNAGGDFMLMSRGNWFKLKGYKEDSYISLHVDSLMVVQAFTCGLSERVFFHPIYHKEHSRRFDAINKSSEEQDRVYSNYKKDVVSMMDSGKTIIYNNEDWGLNKMSLNEFNT